MAITRITKPTLQALEEVKAATAIEREWFKGRSRFETDADILSAIESGHLIKVEADGDILPIQRLRVSATRGYIGQLAARRLSEMSRLWRAELDEKRIDPQNELRIAVTSLVRPVTRTQELIESGALAVEDSSHELGEAADMDASAYYRITKSKRLQSITHPDRPPGKIRQIGDEIRAATGTQEDTSPEYRPDLYNGQVTDALVVVAKRMMDNGLINTVIEFAETGNQCVHWAANPHAV